MKHNFFSKHTKMNGGGSGGWDCSGQRSGYWTAWGRQCLRMVMDGSTITSIHGLANGGNDRSETRLHKRKHAS